MRTFQKCLTVCVLIVIILSLSVFGVCAETGTQDGLTVTITTDKSTYGADEPITAILTVTNTNDAAMHSVVLKQLVPVGYQLSEGQTNSKSVVDLQAGQSVSLTVTWTAVAELDWGFDLTGLNENGKTFVYIVGIALGGILLAALVVLGIHKRSHRLVSIFLCATMLFGTISGTVIQAQALGSAKGKIKVTTVVTVDGRKTKLKGTADYSMKSEKTTEAICTVTFDTMGGSAVEPQQVDNGGLAVRPDVPTREGHVFVGWYADAELENLFDFATPITRSCTVYAYWINTEDETDTDGDGLTDELERYFGTDKEKVDTDGDGLSDYVEALEIGTDPLLKDTDGDGVLDSDEDTDTDGLADKTEMNLSTDILSMDTDGDGLLDGEEVHTYQTDPLKADTDEDGANDKWELDNGFNSLEFNENFDTVSTAAASEVAVSVVLNLPGDQAETLTVTPVLDNPYLTNQIPGYIDVPFEFSVENEFEGTATISFEFDKNLLADETFVPTVYYFNEETMALEELVTVIDPETGIASTEVEHFSTYILLNKTDFDTVWNTEIKPPLADGESADEITLDMVFVIDYSLSMDWNDPDQLFKSLSEEFIRKLRDGKNKAGAVKFIKKATLVSGLTQDKSAVISAINGITYNDGYGSYAGTDGSAGIKMAIDELLKSDAEYQFIIFITDGEDNGFSYTYDSLIQTANENDITIYAVGMGTASEEILKKVSGQTGGSYYHATTGVSLDDIMNLDEVFRDIEASTIDLTIDENKDKIPDYYTKVLCDSKAYVNGALNPFNGLDFETVQSNADYDGDGLLNGEEFFIKESDGKVYAAMTSNPTKQDSDDDGYSDYDELNMYYSNPMRQNIMFREDDIGFLVDNNNFYSHEYLVQYENNIMEAVGVWLGNNVYGDNYNTKQMYKTILMEYLEQMIIEEEDNNEVIDTIETTTQILDVLTQLVESFMDFKEGYDKAGLSDTIREMKKAKKYIMEHFTDTKQYLVERYFREGIDAYKKAAEKFGITNKQIKIDKKISNGAEVFGIVLDIADIATTGWELATAYASFNSRIKEMDKCIGILKIIYVSPDAPRDLRLACEDLIISIEKERAFNIRNLEDALQIIAFKTVKIAATAVIAAIPIVGPIYIAVELALGLADLGFNFSNIAEQSTYLYAISKSSAILAQSINHKVSSSPKNDGWICMYGDLDEMAYHYYGLAIMRKTSEKQMLAKNQEEADSFLLGWYYEKHHKTDELNDNIKKIDSIKHNYSTYFQEHAS